MKQASGGREPKNIGSSLKNGRKEKEQVGQKEGPVTGSSEKKGGKK